MYPQRIILKKSKKVLPHIVGKLISRAFQRTRGFRVFGGFIISKGHVNKIVCPENERLCSFEFMRAIHARQFCDVANILYVGFTTIFFPLDNDGCFFSDTVTIKQEQ